MSKPGRQNFTAAAYAGCVCGTGLTRDQLSGTAIRIYACNMFIFSDAK